MNAYSVVRHMTETFVLQRQDNGDVDLWVLGMRQDLLSSSYHRLWLWGWVGSRAGNKHTKFVSTPIPTVLTECFFVFLKSRKKNKWL